MQDSKNKFEKNTNYHDTQSASVKVRPSFREARDSARAQIALNIPGYHKTDISQLEELALIIAEVYLMPPDRLVTISGEQLECYIVQEVFRELDESHARMVIDNFNRAAYEIKNKKAYLRTALYNSVFELASAFANEVARDFGAPPKDRQKEGKRGEF